MIIPEFDRHTYKLVLQNLPPEERQLLEMIVEESGGIDKFTEMVNSAVGPEIVIESDFDYLNSNPQALDQMSDEEFEYFIGNEPQVTKAQEEMAWQETDKLLSKFFKRQ